MRRRSIVAGVAAALSVAMLATSPSIANAAPTPAAHVPHGSGLHKVGYFVQWGIYGRQYYVKNLDTSGQAANLTELDYAFANVDATGQCSSADTWADYQRPVSAAESVDGVADVAGQPLSGNFNQLRKLKLKYPKLKVLLSVGGWSLSANFSTAAATQAGRQALVSSCISTFLSTGVFDGFDIDWEWPASDGNAGNAQSPADKQNYTALLAEFRKQLDTYGAGHKHYELSAFLPAAPAKISAGFEADQIFKSLDFGDVQGYDFHGSWENTTNQSSALVAPSGDPVPSDFSDVAALNAWTSAGAPRHQLVLGLPYYGQGWTGVPAGTTHGLYQTATGPAQGVFAAGTEDYKTLKTKTTQGYQVYHNYLAGFAWIYDGTTFWTYDDPSILAEKALYVRLGGYGGTMAWELDGDDANGTLTKTVSTVIG